MFIAGGLELVVVVWEVLFMFGKLIKLFTGAAIEGFELETSGGAAMGTLEFELVGRVGDKLTSRFLC